MQSISTEVGEFIKTHQDSITWGSRTVSKYDFRSDVITTPSLNMLSAIITTTLGDDVFREDVTTMAFEAEVATLCGHEAGAFVISGTMANQLSLRALLTQPPHSILAAANAHIIHFEAGGPAFFSGAMVQAIRPMNGRYLTLEDIIKHAVLTDDVHKCPTTVISLENTTAGIVVPLSEMRLISAWARANGVKLHMDGARLFEAVAAGAGSLRDYASLFDLVSLDFSKNLGAPMGAMVIGSSDLIHQVRRIRKSIGGGMRQSGVLSSAARAALHENFGLSEWDSMGKLRTVHEIARRIGEMWVTRGGRLLKDVETNQVWVNLRATGWDEARWNDLGRKHGIKLDGKRIVFHRQISEDALRRLEAVFDDVLVPRAGRARL